MRSTRASAAVERLKRRSDNPGFSVAMVSGGLFYLLDRTNGDQKCCDPLPLDNFVTFVDKFGPLTPVKRSKLDVAFEAQISGSGKEQY